MMDFEVQTFVTLKTGQEFGLRQARSLRQRNGRGIAQFSHDEMTLNGQTGVCPARGPSETGETGLSGLSGLSGYLVERN